MVETESWARLRRAAYSVGLYMDYYRKHRHLAVLSYPSNPYWGGGIVHIPDGSLPNEEYQQELWYPWKRYGWYRYIHTPLVGLSETVDHAEFRSWIIGRISAKLVRILGYALEVRVVLCALAYLEGAAASDSRLTLEQGVVPRPPPCDYATPGLVLARGEDRVHIEVQKRKKGIHRAATWPPSENHLRGDAYPVSVGGGTPVTDEKDPWFQKGGYEPRFPLRSIRRVDVSETIASVTSTAEAVQLTISTDLSHLCVSLSPTSARDLGVALVGPKDKEKR
jgi:hypothetical protein